MLLEVLLMIVSVMWLLFEPVAPTTQNFAIEREQIYRSLESKGVINPHALWGEHHQISVCWLDRPQNISKDELSQYRRWVQRAVHDTWEANSSVRFVGWTDCAASGADIEITVVDAATRSLVGTNSRYDTPSMWLNFKFEKWNPKNKNCRSTAAAFKKCIQGLGVHEFGHAAGFEHEQLSPKTPKECREKLIAEHEIESYFANPRPLTDYDANSVMNYCNPDSLNGLLSDSDKKAIQILFPNE